MGNSGFTAAGQALEETGAQINEDQELLKGNKLMEMPFMSSAQENGHVYHV